MKKDNKLDDKVIDDVIEWAAEADPTKVDMWLDFCARYLKVWKWNKAAIETFIKWGEHGFNDENHHKEFTLEEFYGEVHYCSDRMSIDRLFRCHMRYRNLTNEVPDAKV